MSHREVLEALSGLLLAMFVAMLSSTVVTNALPRIVTDLHGSQTGYTWIVVATLLAMTASTPIWGKLADQFSKKLLVQSALVIYTVGSLIAALAPNMQVLIGARVVQGLGVGGLTALVQVVIASMVSPRERGRYAGLHRRDVRAGHRLRPAHRRPDRRLPARLARHLLRRPADRGRGVRRAPGQAAPAGREAPGPDRLPRRHADRRRRQHPARVGLPGRPAVRLDLGHERRDGRRRPRGHRRRAVRRGEGRGRADHPAAPVQGPHHVARHRRPPSSSASRCSVRPSTSASTSRTPAA